MDEIADYYVTLKPIREGAPHAIGMRNIAYVNDPALDEIGIFLSEQDARFVADENTQKQILDYLKTCGIVRPDNWKESTEDEYLADREINLAVTDQESYNDVTKKDGSGQWLVRYEYTGPRDSLNRSFCAEILDLGKLYTEEEIVNGLSNPDFKGYSIFTYKGSYGCRHVWKRRIYFEDYEDGDVRRVGFVPQVAMRLDDREAQTLNAYLSKDEKMQVLAPLLIPDKKIFRNDEIGRYNMIFSKETIQELYNIALSKGVFEKEDLFKDTHVGGKAPSYVLESWISESETDKAYTEYGLDPTRLKVGTLFVLSQVTDKDYWEKEIKANKKYAYSIEALMNLSIIKMSKMEKEQIVLPDGEHLISGTLYVVKDGIVIEKKEVTSEQEEIIEEVAETAPEAMSETPVEEVKPVEEMEESPTATITEETALPEDDRLTKLEKTLEELLMEIAKLKGELEAPKLEELPIEMSDKRPMWKRVSDGINANKKQK